LAFDSVSIFTIYIESSILVVEDLLV